MRHTIIIFTAVLFGSAAGCSMLFTEPAVPVVVVEDRPLAGPYLLSFHSLWSGSITGRIEVEATAAGLKGVTRSGCAGELIGGLKGFLLNALGLGGVTDGAVMNWQSPLPKDNEVVRGELQLPMMKLATDLRSLDEPLTIRHPSSGLVFGYVTLQALADAPPPGGYDGLVDAIEQTLDTQLYDPAVSEADATRDLIKNLRHVAEHARDDVEFYLGFMWYSRNAGFSHLGLSRTLDPKFEAELQPTRQECRNTVTIRDGIATWRARHFGTADCIERIDGIFAELEEAGVEGLVLDLRSNAGSDYGWYQVAAHLVDSSADVGWYLTRRGQTAAEDPLDTAPVLALDCSGTRCAVTVAGEPHEDVVLGSESGAATLLAFYEQHGFDASLQRISSCTPTYSGPLAVLIDKGTYSGAECLAAFLQEQGRGTIIGVTPSAGAALLPIEVEIADGWLLTLPAAQYLTAQRVVLEGRGVIPDMRVKPVDVSTAIRHVLAGDPPPTVVSANPT